MKQNIEKFIKYCKKEKGICIASIVIMFIIFGSHLFTKNISVDTETFILNPTSNYNWLNIGRYGLVFVKNILGLKSFNPYYSAGVFFILAIIVSIYWQYILNTYTKNKNKILSLLSLFLIFSSAIYTEQFYFTLQRTEIMLGVLLTLISSNLSIQFMSNKEKKFAITSIILNVISFAIYQSFIGLYLSLVIGIYLLKNNAQEQKNVKLELKRLKNNIVDEGLIFLISYVIFTLISKYYTDSNYLLSSIRWGKESILVVIFGIILRIGYILIINNQFYDWSLLIISILLIIFQIKIMIKKNIIYKIKTVAAILLFLVTPFLFIIYSGSNQAVRSFLNLPFVISLGFFIVYDSIKFAFKKNIVQKVLYSSLVIVCLFFSFKQYFMSSRLYYADDIISEYDNNLALNIYKDAASRVENLDDYHLVIIGKSDYKLPASAQEGEMIGQSFFNIHAGIEPRYFWTNIRISNIIKINGYKMFSPTMPEMTSKAIDYIKANPNLPVYPNEKSIVVKDDLVIVKLSENID